MTATETITRKKLKIRIGSIIIGADSGTKPCQLGQRLVVGTECCQSVSAGTCNKSETMKPHNSVIPSLDTSKDVKSSSMVSNKRGLSEVGEVQKEKRSQLGQRLVVGSECCQSVSAGTCSKSETIKPHNSVIPSLDTSKDVKFSSMVSKKRGLSEVGELQKEKRRQLSQRLVVGSECCQSVSVGTSNKSEMIKPHNSVIPSLDTSKNVKFSSMVSNKRGLSEVGEVQKEKRRKMDRSVTQQCAILLKQLMFHPAGWVFNQPVDPVKLQIPDYYDIISEPMDLGTVKRKLNNNEYSSVDEFTAHVRLTFSNAMRYNPHDNNVHLMAKDLNDLFNLKWNALEAKWSRGHKKVEQRQNISRIVKHTDYSCKNGIDVRTLPKGPVSAVEKQELRKQLLGLLRGKVPSHLQGFSRKSGFNLRRPEKIEEVMDAISDEDLWELRKTITSCLVRTAKVAPPKEPDHIGQKSGTKIIRHKGTGNGTGSTTGSANVIRPPNSGTSICGSCRRMRCQCNKRSDVAHEPSGQSSCPSVPTKDTATTSPEGWAPLVDDVPLSPQKALRATMLKSRFADTILKAKQKALRDHEDKADPVKFKQEKERLKRQQQEERAGIKAQIRASKEVARLTAEAERKLQREREREAARLALQQMVKTVEINNDHTVVKDLELLSGCSLSYQFSCNSCGSNPKVGSSESGHSFRVLEQLGLFMKEDYMKYEDEDATVLSGRGDVEEGELFP